MADDKTISELTDGDGPRSTDLFPAVRGGANVRTSFAEAAALSSVLSTDVIPVVRGTTFHLATVAAVLAAGGGVTPPVPGGGALDFSDPDNSAYAALI